MAGESVRPEEASARSMPASLDESDLHLQRDGEDGTEEPAPVSVVPGALTELHELLTRTNYWGERVDLKAAILMAGVTAVFAGEVAALGQMVDWAHRAGFVRWVPLLLIGASLLVLLGAGLMGGLSFYPQLGPAYEFSGTIAPGDLLYFGRLRSIPADRITHEIRRAVQDGSLIDHYSEQLHHNAGLVFRKHVQLQRGILGFGLAVVLGLLGLLCWVLVAAS